MNKDKAEMHGSGSSEATLSESASTCQSHGNVGEITQHSIYASEDVDSLQALNASPPVQ